VCPGTMHVYLGAQIERASLHQRLRAGDKKQRALQYFLNTRPDGMPILERKEAWKFATVRNNPQVALHKGPGPPIGLGWGNGGPTF
jgi:hypothetical protein